MQRCLRLINKMKIKKYIPKGINKNKMNKRINLIINNEHKLINLGTIYLINLKMKSILCNNLDKKLQKKYIVNYKQDNNS